MSLEKEEGIFGLSISNGVIDIKAQLTIRDYFAAAALKGRLSARCNDDGDSNTFEAAICYQIADSMIAERNK